MMAGFVLHSYLLIENILFVIPLEFPVFTYINVYVLLLASINNLNMLFYCK